ncbi:hypothetical protein FSARC_11810 [Fusarium sarcochroum]|uniref:Zonadhesin n=1 Tax=Fusarium sarcochroum TaxID=1208366 RepID=A0A8H4WZF0_9HYPO|nr:hypothetical protein FSARC_11810 [Fusarium sarcochroum]
MKLLYWLTAAYVAQAAARPGQRAMRKRQVVAEVEAVEEAPSATAPKFEGLRLSYVTDTTTQKVTETQMQTVVHTVTDEASVAAQAVTVTVSAAAVTVTVNAAAVTVTEVKTEVVTETVNSVVTQIDTQYITQVAAAAPAVTITETITQPVDKPVTVVEVKPITIVDVSPFTVHDSVTQKVTVTGKAAPAVTLIHTVEAPARESDVAFGRLLSPGVTTIPIDEDSLPTTTFENDPFAPSSVKKEPITTETTAPEVPAGSVSEPAAPSQDKPSEYAPSMELGNMGPDATGKLASAVLDGPQATTAPEAEEPAPSRAPIDLSDSKLSSVLDLGNLGGGSGLKARATGTA